MMALQKKWGAWWNSNGEERKTEKVVTIYSPLSYRNPCITIMRSVIERILEMREITYQKLALVVIDIEHAELGENVDRLDELFETANDIEYQKKAADEQDIQKVLEQMTPDLNELVLVTDRPIFYKKFVHDMYAEYGLLVQRVPKEEAIRVRGNVVLDFERSLETCRQLRMSRGFCYVPIYKKQWEIAENLDISIPVGYNTIVIKNTE